MIQPMINIQVCHHPDSDHIAAEGRKSCWMSFGNMTYMQAAQEFAKLHSMEQLNDRPIRVLVRDENIPKVVHDLYVHICVRYKCTHTFPERNAIGYQNPAT